MSPEVTVLFLLLAFACFVLAALAVSVRKINLLGAGLALWVAVPLWAAVERI